MKHWSYSKIIFYITLLAGSVAFSTVAILTSSYEYLLVLLPTIIISIVKLVKLYLDSIKKVTFMFNAIDCDDYNFRFSDDTSALYGPMLNASLNRIKEIMTNAKLRAIEREKYYELIMNSVKTGIITINDNGNVYHVNNEALRILGVSLLTHINQLNKIDTKLSTSLLDIKTGERIQVAYRNERGEVNLSVTASAMQYDGKQLRILAINDINNELDEKQVESWAKLTRVLTHEIMNSLAPITSLSDTLISINNNKDAEMAQGLETISTTGKSLIAFVDSYRKFTRLQPPRCAPFHLKPLVDNVVKLLCCNDFNLTISIKPEDIMLYADEDMVMQVLVNLLKNGSQAAIDSIEKRIDVDAHLTNDEKVVIVISNSGPAIPPEIAEDIFTPFFTTKREGSGIGLSIAKQVMHLHGGTIQLTSNKDGNVAFTLIFS